MSPAPEENAKNCLFCTSKVGKKNTFLGSPTNIVTSEIGCTTSIVYFVEIGIAVKIARLC